MLKVLHNHIFAGKLREVFATSPLVFIYQSLGHVSIADLSSAVQEGLDKQLPGSGIQTGVCRMRNSVAGSTGNETLQHLFQASNLVLGFQAPMPQQQQLQQQQHQLGLQHQQRLQQLKASRHSSIEELMGGLLQQPAPATSSQPHLPQPMMKALIDAGLKLPAQQPIALLGAFYQRKPIKLAHLAEWRKLDSSQVYSELIGQLEAPLEALCDLDLAMEQLVGALDDAGPHDLLQALDFREASSPAAQEVADGSKVVVTGAS